jgi:ribose/xylose/arabinose/galactoside ABC-type transport system permease subunit
LLGKLCLDFRTTCRWPTLAWGRRLQLRDGRSELPIPIAVWLAATGAPVGLVNSFSVSIRVPAIATLGMLYIAKVSLS